MMKLILFLLFIFNSFAQINHFDNSQIGDVSALDPKLILQLNSTTKGSLIAPKLTTAQRLLILPPIPGGTVVFDTDLNAYMGWNSLNSTWKAIGGGAASLSNWTPTTVYKIGDSIVSVADNNDVFRSLTDHTSTASFNADRLANNWEKISPTTIKVFTPATQYFKGDLIKTFDEQLFEARVNFIANADPVIDMDLKNIEFRSPGDLSTSPLRGGAVTYAAGNYSVTAGWGVQVKTAGGQFPYITPINWIATTIPEPLPNPTGYNTIQVNGTGIVGAVSGLSGAAASKDNIILATIFAPTRDIMVRGSPAEDHGNTMRTLSLMMGIVKSGMIFTGNANLTFVTTAGSIFFDGIGKGTETPNLKSCPAQNPTSFRLYDRDTDLGIATNIPNAQYDVGGVQTAIPGTNWGYHKIFLAPNCQIIFQYGQDVAPSKNEITALEDNNRDTYVVNPQLQGIVKFIGVVYFQNGNANFADLAKTFWRNSGLFGIGSAGSGSSITATGDILGPDASIDSHPMLFDGVTGKLAKDASGATFDPTGGLILDGGTAGLQITKPTGSANLQTNGLTFTDTASTFALSLLPAPIPTGNVTLIFPPNPPQDTQILQSDAFGQLSWAPNGSLTNWQGTHDYIVGETVVSPIDSNDIFRALIAHTSGANFTADRLAGNWEMISPTHYIPFTPTKQYFTNDLISTNDGAIWRATANFIGAALPATDIGAGRMAPLSPSDYTTSKTSGGVVTFGAPNYSITAGTGFIVANGGTPFSTITNVSWNAATIPEPLPVPGGVNTISVSSAGVVSVSGGLESPASAKASIILATIFAPTRTITLRGGPTSDHGNTNRSLSILMGMLKDKIEFTGNNDNTFQTKAGSIYFDGISPGTEQPNIINCPVQAITNFNYYDRDSTISTNQTLLDTYNYDVGGILTAIPVGQWSYSKIFLSPNCRVYVQHGQDIAASEAAITSAELAGRNSYVTNPALTVGTKFVGLVFFQAQTNVMTESPTVTWVNSGLFGMGVAGSGSSVTTAGDVFGPASSTDRAIAVFSGGGGKTLIDTVPTIDAAGSISNISNLSVKGINTNPFAAPTSAVTFKTGRTSANGLFANQTNADIAFESGSASGGFKHYISTKHDSVANTNGNAIKFHINNSATALDSDGPDDVDNVNSLTITPIGVGVMTDVPFKALDVKGDIITTFHGNTSPHDATELGTRAIGHVSGNNFANQFAGMKVEIKNVESSHLTTKPSMANNSDITWHTWGNSLWNTKEVMRLTARGRLGINTATPQAILHVNGDAIFGTVQAAAAAANVGVARVTITGPNGNAGGPHMSFNNDTDQYPIRHFLNWTHDNVWDCFDCYYGPDGAGAGGNNIRGSTASSAFRWQKTATDLILQSDPNPTAGGILTITNKFWVNENGPATFANTVTAGTGVGANDILGNGDLSRIALEEAKSFNPVVLANCNGWPGGCATNPLSTHPTANGMYLSNANWSGTLYLPAVKPVGTAFYYQSDATSTAQLQIDRSNLTSQLGVPNGWTQTFVSDGARWNYAGQKTNALFNAARVWPTSTTTIGFGTNGQVLKTNGAGSLSWGNDVLLMSAEMSSMKKTIADLLKRIKALEKKK